MDILEITKRNRQIFKSYFMYGYIYSLSFSNRRSKKKYDD